MTPVQMLASAYALAATAHKDQLDKSGRPYFEHVSKVRYILKSDDDELNAIAILHDLLEDTDTTVQDLYDCGMSNRIVKGVVALTKTEGQDYDSYIHQVIRNKDAAMVKMADLRHNSDLRRQKDIRQKDFERTVKYMKTYNMIKEFLENNIYAEEAPRMQSGDYGLRSNDPHSPLSDIVFNNTVLGVYKMPEESKRVNSGCMDCSFQETDGDELVIDNEYSCKSFDCTDWSNTVHNVYFKVKSIG